jgi:hypothetical protein
MSSGELLEAQPHSLIVRVVSSVLDKLISDNLKSPAVGQNLSIVCIFLIL